VVLSALAVAGCGAGASRGTGSAPARTTVAAAGSTDAAVGRRIDAYLTDLVGRHQFRGSVLVARGDSIVLDKGYDTGANADSAHTRYRIGSLTKQFTALAVLKLQEQGRLRVTDRVCVHLPECPPAWRQVTIAQLLTHTSGIPDYTTLSDYAAVSTTTRTPDQLMALFRDKPLQFRPGSQWKYSNSGYALLGYVIERTARMSYASFLQREILDPLGLTETGYDTDRPDPVTHAIGYADWTHPAAYLDMSIPYAAGALYSTTTDLYRWDRFLLTDSPRIVTPATLAQLFTPRVSIDPHATKASRYGYGWFIDGSPANPIYDHDGDINGFVSLNQIQPRGQLAIAILSNLEPTEVRDIGDEIIATLGG